VQRSVPLGLPPSTHPTGVIDARVCRLGRLLGRPTSAQHTRLGDAAAALMLVDVVTPRGRTDGTRDRQEAPTGAGLLTARRVSVPSGLEVEQ
jgi:hypothetical protein